MGSVNRVFLLGRLTRDPEVRRLPSGTAVAEFGLAMSEDYRNKAGELVKSVCFVETVVWDKQAEAVEKYLKKGSEVVVEGKLQLDQWQTPQGEKRSRLKVRCVRVQFVGGRKTEAQLEATPTEERAALATVSDEDDHLPF